jgi:hypothetical protein
MCSILSLIASKSRLFAGRDQQALALDALESAAIVAREDD